MNALHPVLAYQEKALEPLPEAALVYLSTTPGAGTGGGVVESEGRGPGGVLSAAEMLLEKRRSSVLHWQPRGVGTGAGAGSSGDSRIISSSTNYNMTAAGALLSSTTTTSTYARKRSSSRSLPLGHDVANFLSALMQYCVYSERVSSLVKIIESLQSIILSGVVHSGTASL